MGIVALLVVVLAVASFLAIGISQRKACPGGKVDLKGRGDIVEYRSDDGILRLRLKKPGSEDTEVILVDECTGRIKGSLTFDDKVLNYPKQ